MSPQKTPQGGARDFLRLAEASPGMIWMADTDGLCTYVNPAWLEFRGRTLEQELGTGWVEGIHPDDREVCQRKVELALRMRSALRLTYRVSSADGSYRTIEDIGHPWSDRDGNFRGYLGSAALLHCDQTMADAARRLSFLSSRERQVLELVAQGWATKQVADKLGIGYKTADSHRTHVLKKLDLHETASLVRFAIRAGVIAA